MVPADGGQLSNALGTFGETIGTFEEGYSPSRNICREAKTDSESISFAACSEPRALRHLDLSLT